MWLISRGKDRQTITLCTDFCPRDLQYSVFRELTEAAEDQTVSNILISKYGNEHE